MLAVMMMLPLAWPNMAGSAAFAVNHTPVRLTARTRAQVASSTRGGPDAGNAGIGDADIDAAELLVHGSRRSGLLLRVGDVEVHGE